MKDNMVKLLKRGISECKKKNNAEASKMTARFYSTLAAHYIREALVSADKRQAGDLFEEATMCLNDAEKRNPSDGSVGIRKGLLLLAKGTLEAASYQFKFVLEQVPESPAAILGEACVQFYIGNFRAALNGFQGLFKLMPSNDLRLAIGYCFHRLGHWDYAFKAFQRVLEKDPSSRQAIIALGFLQLDNTADQKALVMGTLKMKEAYEADKSDALPSIHLANHFFFKKDFNKARALADGSALSAKNDRVKAEALFIQAKIAHVNVGPNYFV